jgi:dTDP-4-amino-4,6-dideoxygalactose transaminase
MIPVTKSFLPPQNEYQAILKEAWDAGWITNRGVLVKRLEEKLKEFLGVHFLTATTNGTLPLQIALKLLGKGGEIITTPFSYVATTSSIVWEGCTPVFVDIHPEYLTIDEYQIEAAITPKTTAILATHVFGNPCAVDTIERIAQKHQLKVIYDAAHAFGVAYQGQSIFNYGDVSTCSFHATKLFHTGEGGAMMCNDPDLHHQLFYSHNFGHNGPLDFHGLGINAKMSELQAAMGLTVLPYMDAILAKRKTLYQAYIAELRSCQVLQFQTIRSETQYNFAYFPLIFPTESILLKVVDALQKEQVFPRRYFYPSLNVLPYVASQPMPVSDSIARRILCLPLFYELTENQVAKISQTVCQNIG